MYWLWYCCKWLIENLLSGEKTTCKPTKIPRITQHQNGGFGIGRLSPTSVLNSETVVGQHLSSSMNSFTVPSYNDHGPMQMLYSSRDIQQTLTQKKAGNEFGVQLLTQNELCCGDIWPCTGCGTVANG
jgi:hypothetical protein